MGHFDNYVNDRMVGNSDRTARWGVHFKHNTGRAVCYFYTDQRPPMDNHESCIPDLESLTVSKLESFKTIQKLDHRNDRDIVISQLWDLEQFQKIGHYECDVIIRVRSVSLVSFYNYVFHIRVIN